MHVIVRIITQVLGRLLHYGAASISVFAKTEPSDKVASFYDEICLFC